MRTNLKSVMGYMGLLVLTSIEETSNARTSLALKRWEWESEAWWDFHSESDSSCSRNSTSGSMASSSKSLRREGGDGGVTVERNKRKKGFKGILGIWRKK